MTTSLHHDFLNAALARLPRDDRIVGTAAGLYCQLRVYHAPVNLRYHIRAEHATLAFLDQVIASQA